MNQESGIVSPTRKRGISRQQAAGNARSLASWGVWLFISLAILLTPIFAHGCHGDDVDHEPLLIPVRLDPENR